MHDSFRQLEKISRDMERSCSTYRNFASQLQKSNFALTIVQESLRKQRAYDKNLFGITSSALSQARLAALSTSNFHDLSTANQRLTELVSNAVIADSALSKIFAEHSVLRASLQSIATKTTVTDLLSSLDTTRLLHTSLSSQYRLLDLESCSFGRLINAPNVLTNDLTANFGKLTRSYRELIECVPRIPVSQVPFVAKFSPIEYSLEMDILERLSVDKHEDVECEDLPSIDDELASFDDRLLALLNGARESLRSDNPDRARHVTTSIRELWTHILHGLAPDSEIRKWSNDDAHYHEGKPTRRARLSYICRKFSCEPLDKFVEDDVRSALTLIKSLNAGTHAIQSKLTEHQLQAIVYRTESSALFLLKISRGG